MQALAIRYVFDLQPMRRFTVVTVATAAMAMASTADH